MGILFSSGLIPAANSLTDYWSFQDESQAESQSVDLQFLDEAHELLKAALEQRPTSRSLVKEAIKRLETALGVNPKAIVKKSSDGLLKADSKDDDEINEWFENGYLGSVVGKDKNRSYSVISSRLEELEDGELDLPATKEDLGKGDGITRDLISSKVKSALGKLSSWDFDIFDLHEATNGHALTAIGLNLFERFHLFERFNLSRKVLVATFMEIETQYLDQPYHNKIHAADVLAGTSFFVMSSSLASTITSLDLVACLIAAAVHDIGHPGTNNAFHVNSQSELAVLYNDQSVLENFHLSRAFAILRDKRTCLLDPLDVEEQKEVRETMITMVLATDMSQHRRHLEELDRALNKKHTDGTWFSYDVKADRLLCLSMALHAADLSNPTKPLELYLLWTERIMEEFYRQGDKERNSGLPISPMMNRETSNVAKSQVGFIDYVISPMYKAWHRVVQEKAEICLYNLEENRNYWQNKLSKHPSESFDE